MKELISFFPTYYTQQQGTAVEKTAFSWRLKALVYPKPISSKPGNQKRAESEIYLLSRQIWPSAELKYWRQQYKSVTIDTFTAKFDSSQRKLSRSLAAGFMHQCFCNLHVCQSHITGCATYFVVLTFSWIIIPLVRKNAPYVRLT